MSHSAAIFLASASSFFFSPWLTRQFSSSTTWPGCTTTPFTQSARSGTSRPSSSAMRLATGASESSGLNAPSVGRPRCEVTITAAPASSAMRMHGSEARMRVSSVMWPASSCGTLRSARMKTRWPATLPAATRSLKRNTFMMSIRVEGAGNGCRLRGSQGGARFCVLASVAACVASRKHCAGRDRSCQDSCLPGLAAAGLAALSCASGLGSAASAAGGLAASSVPALSCGATESILFSRM